MTCNFHVGQKVVCVRREEIVGAILLDPVQRPEVGKVYTVRRVHLASELSSKPGVIGLLFNEIDDQWPRIILHGLEYPRQIFFEAINFRPLVERKTDISHLQIHVEPISGKGRRMSISIYFGLAVSAVLSIFFLALVKGGSRKSAWEQQRQDDEQMEALAEQEAIRAIERDLFDGTGTEARYF